MFYTFAIGQIRIHSEQSINFVRHEMRHYGSVVSSFRTVEQKTAIAEILERHYNYLTIKEYLKDPNKRFASSKLGTDIAQTHSIISSKELEVVCRKNHYGFTIRDFGGALSEQLPTLSTLPLRITARIVLINKEVKLRVYFEVTDKGAFTLEHPIVPGGTNRLSTGELSKTFAEHSGEQAITLLNTLCGLY